MPENVEGCRYCLSHKIEIVFMKLFFILHYQCFAVFLTWKNILSQIFLVLYEKRIRNSFAPQVIEVLVIMKQLLSFDALFASYFFVMFGKFLCQLVPGIVELAFLWEHGLLLFWQVFCFSIYLAEGFFERWLATAF